MSVSTLRLGERQKMGRHGVILGADASRLLIQSGNGDGGNNRPAASYTPAKR